MTHLSRPATLEGLNKFIAALHSDTTNETELVA